MSTEPITPKSKWKSILLYTFAALVAAIGVLCIVISLRSDDFKVARSATFKATPAAVFEQVNDFHKWEAWSPWAKLDPNAKSTFEGPTRGEGTKMSWDGNMEVGEGNMTIVESKPNELVRIRLEFIRPMAGVNDVEMKIEPKGDETAAHLEYGRQKRLHGQGDRPVHGLRKDVRRLFRARPFQYESDRRSRTCETGGRPACGGADRHVRASRCERLVRVSKKVFAWEG